MSSAELVVVRLKHIARWTHLKQLVNPVSGLAGEVEVWWSAAVSGLFRGTGAAVLLNGRGEIGLSYRWMGGRWVPPRVFVRLRNMSPPVVPCCST